MFWQEWTLPAKPDVRNDCGSAGKCQRNASHWARFTSETQLCRVCRHLQVSGGTKASFTANKTCPGLNFHAAAHDFPMTRQRSLDVISCKVEYFTAGTLRKSVGFWMVSRVPPNWVTHENLVFCLFLPSSSGLSDSDWGCKVRDIQTGCPSWYQTEKDIQISSYSSGRSWVKFSIFKNFFGSSKLPHSGTRSIWALLESTVSTLTWCPSVSRPFRDLLRNQQIPWGRHQPTSPSSLHASSSLPTVDEMTTWNASTSGHFYKFWKPIWRNGWQLSFC